MCSAPAGDSHISGCGAGTQPRWDLAGQQYLNHLGGRIGAEPFYQVNRALSKTNLGTFTFYLSAFQNRAGQRSPKECSRKEMDEGNHSHGKTGFARAPWKISECCPFPEVGSPPSFALFPHRWRIAAPDSLTCYSRFASL